MPQVNLTDLNAQQLRQLLDSSRRRGDASLSYTILQEMDARRTAPAGRGPFKTRHPAEPHVVAVDLSDPMETDDLPPLPNWRAPAYDVESSTSVLPEPEDASPVAATEDDLPPPALKTSRPRKLPDAEPEPFPVEEAATQDEGLRMEPVRLERPPAPRRPRSRGILGFALGIVVGVGLGWWGSRIARDVLAPPAAPPAAAIQTGPLAPTPALSSAAPRPAAAAEAPPPPAVAPANTQESAADPDSPAVEPPPPPTPPNAGAEPAGTTEAAQPAVAKGCAAAPTPADRTICGDPELQRLQAELRRAYTEALAAHEDRTLLREHQLAWRDARNTVTDPERLARLYEERIRKLNAATAEAKAQR